MAAYPEVRALLEALFLGVADRERADWARITGVVHLYAMSGLHLYVFLDLVERAAFYLGRSLGIPASAVRRTAFLVAVVTWVGVWSLQAYRPGMLKPLILVTLRAGGRTLGIRYELLAPLIIAVSVAGAIVGYNIGSIVYFLAVAGGVIALQSTHKPGIHRRLGPHTAMALGSWLLVVPFDLIEHRGVAILTPLLSLLSIPIVTGIVIPSAICEALGADVSWSWAWCEWALRGLSRIAEITGNLWVCLPTASIFGFGLAVILHLAVPKAAKKFTLLVCVLVSFGLRPWVSVREPEVIQLNVGQGDSAVVAHGDGSASIIDAGPPSALTRARWLKTLSHYGVNRVSGVLLTHGDLDHRGGMVALSRAVQIDSNFMYPVFKACGGKAGNRAMRGTVVPVGSGAYVNLGDSNERQEEKMLSQLSTWLNKTQRRCTILKVSHHGSRTSSSPNLLSLCQGARAWISAGRKNPHGHPHAAVVARLAKYGLLIEATGTLGDLKSKGVHRRPP